MKKDKIDLLKTISYRLLAIRLIITLGIIMPGVIARAQTIGKDSIKSAPVIIYNTFPPGPDSNIHIYEPPLVKNVVQKVYDYQRCSHGMSPGFRVQIDFGQDRNAINKTKSDFALKYPSIPSYISYKQPYFKMSVGDFRTKLDAVRFLNTVKKDYPAAFIVTEKIMPPPL